ncbi:MAG: hypothetical protein PWP31_50 [Clostridia bacterium]|nr:hypothetical protein [Clostridia bacterium]
MLFKDRHDAGCRLTKALEAYRGRQPLVLANLQTFIEREVAEIKRRPFTLYLHI